MKNPCPTGVIASQYEFATGFGLFGPGFLGLGIPARPDRWSLTISCVGDFPLHCSVNNENDTSGIFLSLFNSSITMTFRDYAPLFLTDIFFSCDGTVQYSWLDVYTNF